MVVLLTDWDHNFDFSCEEWSSEDNLSLHLNVVAWELSSLNDLTIVPLDPFAILHVLKLETTDNSSSAAAMDDFLEDELVDHVVLTGWELSCDSEIFIAVGVLWIEAVLRIDSNVVFSTPS